MAAAESLFETFQALLNGYDTAQAQRWREEDRQWRKEDMEWRDRERYYGDVSVDHIKREWVWRREDLDQRLLDNVRVLWQRFVDRTRSDMEERSEQLKGISNLAALVAGFAVSGFLQFDVEPDQGGTFIFMCFGITTAIVVAVMMNSMMACSLIQASILKTGRKFVSEAEEAAFMQDCLEWYREYRPGRRPPAPQRTFTKHWLAQCEGEWVRSFFMFSAGVPVFFANLAVAAYIKFYFARSVAVAVTVIMGLALAYFLVSQVRWVAHILERGGGANLAAWDPGSSSANGLPWDWHLPPEPFLRRRRSQVPRSPSWQQQRNGGSASTGMSPWPSMPRHQEVEEEEGFPGAEPGGGDEQQPPNSSVAPTAPHRDVGGSNGQQPFQQGGDALLHDSSATGVPLHLSQLAASRAAGAEASNPASEDGNADGNSGSNPSGRPLSEQRRSLGSRLSSRLSSRLASAASMRRAGGRGATAGGNNNSSSSSSSSPRAATGTPPVRGMQQHAVQLGRLDDAEQGRARAGQ